MDGVKVKFVKINLKNNCKSAGKYHGANFFFSLPKL